MAESLREWLLKVSVSSPTRTPSCSGACPERSRRVSSVFKVSHLTPHPSATIFARMNVVKATRQFEAWLAQRTRIDQKDLRLKHTNMKKDVFMFFRATYYRWASEVFLGSIDTSNP